MYEPHIASRAADRRGKEGDDAEAQPRMQCRAPVAPDVLEPGSLRANLRASASSTARTSRSTPGRDALVARRGTRPSCLRVSTGDAESSRAERVATTESFGGVRNA